MSFSVVNKNQVLFIDWTIVSPEVSGELFLHNETNSL